MIRYIFSAREDADLESIKEQVEAISRERSEELMSIAQKLEQRGLEKGMQLGKAEGIELGKEQGIELGKAQGLKLGIIEGKKQGIEQGMKQGMQQGMEQGERKKMLEVAKNMLDMNSEVEFIVRATGLSREEIEKLQQEE